MVKQLLLKSEKQGADLIAVFDVAGRLVRSLVRTELPAGEYAVSWNGSDSLGRPVASGAYFARLTTASGERSRRMVLMK